MQRFAIFRITAAALILSAAPVVTTAQVPVVDPAGIAQDITNSARQIAEMVRHYEQMLDQYRMLEQQRNLLENQVNALSGRTDLSDVSSRKIRRLANSIDMLGYTLDSTADATGLPDTASAAIERRSITLGLDDGLLGAYRTSDIPARRIVAERGSAGLVTSGLGENGYDQSNELAEDAEGLRNELGQQEELKEAVDYNTAVLLKSLEVQIEVLRGISAIALTTGTEAAATAAEGATQIDYAGEDR
ncbi:type IV secretion system protein [uncultured Ruegeria sp.]|uniref:type IV secretion system protein n=1 Tax=uncultured Ruegeria sp. TaxID=259304 RepID=UPI00263850EA|nr:type IV secretion system protein [uncultured Ruegeria sp.]